MDVLGSLWTKLIITRINEKTGSMSYVTASRSSSIFSVILLRWFVRRSPKTSKGKRQMLWVIKEEILF